MKLKLTIAGNEVELTTEEAKKLYAELEKVFGGKVVVVDRRNEPPIFRSPKPQIVGPTTDRSYRMSSY